MTTKLPDFHIVFSDFEEYGHINSLSKEKIVKLYNSKSQKKKNSIQQQQNTRIRDDNLLSKKKILEPISFK